MSMARPLEDSLPRVSRCAWRRPASGRTLDLTMHAHCGRGPKRSLLRVSRSTGPRSSCPGPQGTGDDALGDLTHLGALAHRRALDVGEGVLLGHLQLVHQHPLGPFDRLAGLELLAEGVDLAGHRPQLPEAPDGDLDGRDEVALLER